MQIALMVKYDYSGLMSKMSKMAISELVIIRLEKVALNFSKIMMA